MRRPAWPAALPVDFRYPSIGEVIAETPLCGADTVDQAVRAAAEAFPKWMETPPVERARILMKLKVMLEDHFEELAQSVEVAFSGFAQQRLRKSFRWG